MDIIRRHTKSGTCNQDFINSWITLWYFLDSYTKNVSIRRKNCERFIEGNGIQIIIECWRKFPNELELRQAIMATIEVLASLEDFCRYVISDDEIVNIVLNGLKQHDNIRVSFINLLLVCRSVRNLIN